MLRCLLPLSLAGCFPYDFSGQWAGACDVGALLDGSSGEIGLEMDVAPADGASLENGTGAWTIYSGSGTVTGSAGAAPATVTLVHCTDEAGCSLEDTAYDSDGYLVDFDFTDPASGAAATALAPGELAEEPEPLEGTCSFSDGVGTYSGAYALERQ